MFWDKKEDKKELPELPPIRSSSLFGGFKKEEPEEELTASLGKPESEDELPELPAKTKIKKSEELAEIPMRKIMPESNKAKTEDVYVKIDKFHSARKALNKARDKLKEVDELMRKIRETKMREEQELDSWEEKISSIKSKVEDVTKNIFEKVE